LSAFETGCRSAGYSLCSPLRGCLAGVPSLRSVRRESGGYGGNAMNNAVVLEDECVFDSDRLWSEAWSSVREANQPFPEDGAMSWEYRRDRSPVFHQRAS